MNDAQPIPIEGVQPCVLTGVLVVCTSVPGSIGHSNAGCTIGLFRSLRSQSFNHGDVLK